MRRLYPVLFAVLVALATAPVSAQAPTIVLLPDQVDNDAGYNGQDLAELANGDILVVYVKNGVMSNSGDEPAELILARSSDNGSSWDPSVTLRTAIPGGSQAIAQPQIVVLPSGRILVSYFYISSFAPFRAGEAALLSDDNGETWTSYDVDGRDIQVLVASASSTSLQPPLVSVYWRERNSNGDLDFWTATSTDEGITWTNERFLAQTDPICGQDFYAASDTDWTFIWADCVFGTGGTNTVYRQRTTDGGATWSASEPLFTAGSAFGTNPHLILDSNGMQSLLHSNGLTMAYRTSEDGGTTWSDAVDWSQGTSASRDIGLTCAAGRETPLCVFQSRRGSTNHLLHFASIDALTTSDEAPAATTAMTLHPNVPNPVASSASITFELAESSDITLTLHDLLGRQVGVLASGPTPAGTHTVTVNAQDLPSGLYVYRLQANEQVTSRRLAVVR